MQQLKIQPGIRILAEKKLIGKCKRMSFAENKTRDLWKSFMPLRTTIKNNINTNLYSLELYKPGYFDNFNPAAEFNKWAAVEVSDFESVPDGMETIILPTGLYAVFEYKGSSEEGAEFYRYIFTVWLPTSDYVLDNRIHFALMGEKYKNGDPNSEEEIWIPIRPKE